VVRASGAERRHRGAEARVYRAAADLVQRDEDEEPLVEARVRYLELGGLLDEITVEKDIDVERPWAEALAAHAAQTGLRAEARGQERLGIEIRLASHDLVQVGTLRRAADRLRLVERAACRHLKALLLDEPEAADEVSLPITEVGPEAEEHGRAGDHFEASDYPRGFGAGNNRSSRMNCPACQSANDDGAEACFTCGKALFAVTQGIILGGRYEVLRPLGAGGMGRVYKAHDRVLDEDVAVKILRPEFTRDREMTRRFRSEIKLARKVGHRNVCRIYEYGEDDALCFISMEYIEGRTLKEQLEVLPPALPEAYALAMQVAYGLRAVHEIGIIHRDFKASNVMIDGKGIVKLMDFGIAKEAGGDTSGHTGSGVLGTPEYMSPEQAGGGKVDLRSDVYSLGCVVFEIFTGRPPFRGDTPLATLYKHQREPPPLEGARVPDALIPLLRVALAKAPADRFPSVSDFIEALRKAQAATPGGGDAASRPFETTTIPKMRRRTGRGSRTMINRVWPWALLGAAVVGLVVAIGGLRLTSPPVERPTERPSQAAEPTAPPRAEPEEPRSRPEPAPISSFPAPTPRKLPAASTLAPAPVSASTGPPTAERAREPQGSLALLVVPEAEVTLDGTSLGRVSMRDLRLAEGTHTIRVLHPDYEPLQRKITVRAGVSLKLVLDLAEKGIKKAP